MAWAIFNDMPMWLQVAEGRLTEILPIKYSNALAQNIAVNYADSGDHYDMAVVSLLHAIRLYRNQTKPCLKKWQNAVLGHLFPPGLRCLDLKSVRIPASNRLAWQKNLHQSCIPPFFKQGLMSLS